MLKFFSPPALHRITLSPPFAKFIQETSTDAAAEPSVQVDTDTDVDVDLQKISERIKSLAKEIAKPREISKSAETFSTRPSQQSPITTTLNHKTRSSTALPFTEGQLLPSSAEPSKVLIVTDKTTSEIKQSNATKRVPKINHGKTLIEAPIAKKIIQIRPIERTAIDDKITQQINAGEIDEDADLIIETSLSTESSTLTQNTPEIENVTEFRTTQKVPTMLIGEQEVTEQQTESTIRSFEVSERNEHHKAQTQVVPDVLATERNEIGRRIIVQTEKTDQFESTKPSLSLTTNRATQSLIFLNATVPLMHQGFALCTIAL